MKIIENEGSITLEFKGNKIFTHSKDLPFINIIKSDFRFKLSHGNVTVKEKSYKKFGLFNYSINNKILDKNIITFSDNENEVKVIIKEINSYLFFELYANGNFGVEFNFNAYKDEGIFGGGEQFRQLNMKGEKIVNLVSEHITVSPIVQKLLLKSLYKEKNHSYIKTYAPMSTYVSSKKYAIRFNTTAYGVADFTKDDISSIMFSECPRSFIYVEGKDFYEIANRLNADCENREYIPNWCYDGMILGVQGGIDRAEEKAKMMIENGAKVCGVWCQDWSGKKVTAVGKQVYWNWEVDDNQYKDLKNRIEKLKQIGVRFLAYINPYLIVDGKLYNYCKSKNYLIKKTDGSIYHIKSTTFDAGMIDLTNPSAVEFLKETIIKKNMLDLGIDGYMADFGEYLPLDSVVYAGDPKKLHNEWPTIWAKINREAVDSHPRAKEVLFFTRSAYNGAQHYTNIMWNGDQHTDFSKDYGMGCVMPASFNLGFSGMTLTHSDIGGYISFSKLKRDRELFIRWFEMNTFTPILRSHETVNPDSNTQPYDNEVLSVIAKLTRIHAELKPYIEKIKEDANKGIPAMKPDFYPSGDFTNHHDLYSYYFGDDIFVCPVIERAATKRKVFLPKGEWISFFDNKEYLGDKNYEIETTLGKPIAFYNKKSKFVELFKNIKF